MQYFACALGTSIISKPETLAKIATSSANAHIKPLTSGWFALDAGTEQEVLVEQTQSVLKPLLGPFEMTMLAGLVSVVLARHLANVLHAASAKTVKLYRRSESGLSSRPQRKG